MPSYIVTLNDDTTEDQIKAAKQLAIDQGGKITHEYTLFKGFTVEMADDAITTLGASEHVRHVEKDGPVCTCG
ncbi:hypothetical protein E4U41_002948 [Claviceps citrina]|nr:hypothetical protein E4U41_002948 [Claviceps citrina]